MLVALAVLVVLLLVGFLYEQISRFRDRRLPLPGRLVDMGGQRLHVTDDGASGPTVVLVHGAGDCSYSWIHVRREVSRFTRVISYDRPGLGASPAGPAPDPVRTIDELHQVLAASGAPGPYVLVGHSLGGLIIRLYAMQHPEQVAGLVFVDSTHERLDEDKSFVQSMKALKTMAPVMRALSHVGLMRILAGLGVMPMYAAERKYYIQQLSPLERRQWLAACHQNSASPAAAQELLSAFPMMAEGRRVMSPTQFGDLPVAVLNNPGFGDFWTEMNRELASRSTCATHRVSDRPGHSIQMPRPELVMEAIRQVIARVQERTARIS